MTSNAEMGRPLPTKEQPPGPVLGFPTNSYWWYCYDDESGLWCPHLVGDLTLFREEVERNWLGDGRWIEATPTPPLAGAGLNLDHDEARALHRIVRAMHDGECPKCHSVFSSERMRNVEYSCVGCSGSRFVSFDGWKCPNCKFAITKVEAQEVFRIFGPFMESNLAIFEKWREQRKAQHDHH